MINVALVVRYGYVSSGTPVSGIIVAFFFAAVAVGGLGGPAMAVHLWQRSRAWSIIVGLLALAALGANVSITFDAVLERGDQAQAERFKVSAAIREDRDVLVRIKRELASLRNYDFITPAVVEAAKAAAAAATESRQAACSSNRGGRSNRCRQREADERQALAAVAEAKANRAATERVNELRAERATIQRRLAEAPPPEDLQTQAPGRVRLFQISKAGAITAATWQKFALAAIVELLIACAFVAFALMRPKAPQQASPSPKPIRSGLWRPRLLSKQTRARKFHEYVVDRLEALDGTAVSFRDVYLDYETWCLHQCTPALAAKEFAERLSRLCEGTDVYTRERNGIIQLVHVRIADAVPSSSLGRALKKWAQSKQQKDEPFTAFSWHR